MFEKGHGGLYRAPKKEESERLRARRRQDVAVVNGQGKFLFQKEMRSFFFLFFLLSSVGERPWWPIQNPNNGRKKKAKG